MKYEFTGETLEHEGVTLRRIRFTDTNEVGGWIEKKENLSQEGDARVYGNAQVYGDAKVSGDARVYGNAQVYGDAKVSGDARDKSPLYIQGSRYHFNMASKESISVGCKLFSINEWRAQYKEIAAEQNYSDQELAEYISYFNLAAKLYGFDPIMEGCDE